LRQDLFGEAGGKVLLNLGELFAKGKFFLDRFSGPFEVMAAFVAKGAIRVAGMPARRAYTVQPGTTILTELGSFSVFEVAVCAFHRFPPVGKKRNGGFETEPRGGTTGRMRAIVKGRFNT
jgi:hypothetical protein